MLVTNTQNMQFTLTGTKIEGRRSKVEGRRSKVETDTLSLIGSNMYLTIIMFVTIHYMTGHPLDIAIL